MHAAYIGFTITTTLTPAGDHYARAERPGFPTVEVIGCDKRNAVKNARAEIRKLLRRAIATA